MKNILCYGDSNTYGLNPITGGRYEYSERWTGVLQKLLGEKYRVIEEGLNGRTTVLDEPGLEYRNGYEYLKACLCSQVPIDYLVLMLGTNDTKTIFGKEACQIAVHMRRLIELAKKVLEEVNEQSCKILLVVPGAISETVVSGPLSCEFGAESAKKSRELAEFYKHEAELAGIDCLDLSMAIKGCDVDGIHLFPEEHKKVAAEIAKWVRR